MSPTEAVDVHEQIDSETFDQMQRDLNTTREGLQKSQRSIEAVELGLTFSTSQLETDLQKKRIKELETQFVKNDQQLGKTLECALQLLKLAVGDLLNRMEEVDVYSYSQEDIAVLLQAVRSVSHAARKLEWIAADQNEEEDETSQG